MYCNMAWIHSRFDAVHSNLVFMNMDTECTALYNNEALYARFESLL